MFGGSLAATVAEELRKQDGEGAGSRAVSVAGNNGLRQARKTPEGLAGGSVP